MIALDTNVLLRYLFADDPEQHRQARDTLEEIIERGERCLVPDIVLVELVWVMRSRYRANRRSVLGVLLSLREARFIEFELPQRFERALEAFATGKGGFADYLIRERSCEQGCRSVMTFDQALLTEDGFTAP